MLQNTPKQTNTALKGGGCGKTGNQRQRGLTIDGDSDALGQSEAVLANEGGNLAKAVSLQMLSSRLAKLDLGYLEVEIIGLGNRLDGDGAGVVLPGSTWLAAIFPGTGGDYTTCLKVGLTYGGGEESAESHLVGSFLWYREAKVTMVVLVGWKEQEEGMAGKQIFLFQRAELGNEPRVTDLRTNRRQGLGART